MTVRTLAGGVVLRDRTHLLSTDSLPECLPWPGLGQAKPESIFFANSIRASVVGGRDPGAGAITCCHMGTHGQDDAWDHGSQNSRHSPVGHEGLRGVFTAMPNVYLSHFLCFLFTFTFKSLFLPKSWKHFFFCKSAQFFRIKLPQIKEKCLRRRNAN